MGMSISGITDCTYTYNTQAIEKQSEDNLTSSGERSSEIVVKADQLTAEQKIQQADEFWAEHDRLYAEQMATVMDTITDGMAVAQEIARRMASGAKVSQSDENTLMQYDSRMYMAAKNAQIMAQKKKDMSNESLIEQFEERHANDRKDWTSELNDKIAVMNNGSAAASETQNIEVSAETTGNAAAISSGSIDISI
ncbi:MAG: hypothetical protein J6K58_08600 [Lachnospiraceae bacterium]|nr:hypothetical protein [Lachnospiraceae bacterium]